MLFILTGDIQIGKTRWLREIVGTLERKGVPVAGVLAPGVWRENAACANGLEKIGIDNEMLPGHELVHFARRRDLLLAEGGGGSLERCGQSETEKLGWAMSDEVIELVDAHFAALEAQVAHDETREDPTCGCGAGAKPSASVGPSVGAKPEAGTDAGPSASGSVGASAGAGANASATVPGDARPCSAPQPGLLVVDELGRLELLRGLGLMHAVSLLRRGPSERWPHAVLIVRDWLLPQAHNLLDATWNGEVEEISPIPAAREKILAAYGAQG